MKVHFKYLVVLALLPFLYLPTVHALPSACVGLIDSSADSNVNIQLDLNYLIEANKEFSQETFPLMARLSKLSANSARYLASRKHGAILKNLIDKKDKLDPDRKNDTVALDTLASELTFLASMHKLTVKSILKSFFDIKNFYRSQGKSLKDQEAISTLQVHLILRMQNSAEVNPLSVLRAYEASADKVAFEARTREGILALVETGASPQKVASLYNQFTRHSTSIPFAMHMTALDHVPFLMRAVLQSRGSVSVERASLAYSFVYKTLVDSVGWKKAVGSITGAEQMGKLAEAFINAKISEAEFKAIVENITSKHILLGRKTMFQAILAELGYPYI